MPGWERRWLAGGLACSEPSMEGRMGPWVSSSGVGKEEVYCSGRRWWQQRTGVEGGGIWGVRWEATSGARGCLRGRGSRILRGQGPDIQLGARAGRIWDYWWPGLWGRRAAVVAL